MRYILRPSLTLLITAVIVIALLSLVHVFTIEPTERQRLLVEQRAMQEVLPGASEYQELDLQLSGNITAIHRAMDGSQTLGYVLQLAVGGYVEDIHVMVGISAVEQKVIGMRILRHRETPGLGSLITRENFFRGFDNRELVPLTVVRGTASADHEIDTIASATITTVAVTSAVNEAIVWFLEGGASL